MENNDPFQIKKNFTAFALFLLVILVAIDVVLRVKPSAIRPGSAEGGRISAVGHQHTFDDGSRYYIYTIFESDGDVYQCWWDEAKWNQKKVTNYKGPTLPEDN